jgi:L-threonylcarbamoyladenylate synthase
LNPIPVNAQTLAQAAKILKQGGLVAFPTETVYGLGADASNPAAVAKIFAAKGRPADHPVIVHLAETAQIYDWAADVPESALQLAQAFWPGPLTMILHKKPAVPLVVTGGQNTVGLRVPSNPAALQLLAAFGGGVAAPSANRFGRISPTTARHVAEELDGLVDCILDGGPCTVGVESTIIDLSAGQPAILRPGRISHSQLKAVLATEIQVAGQKAAQRDIRAPGMLAVHYAPVTEARLCAAETLPALVEELNAAGKRFGILAFSHASTQLPCAHRLLLPDQAEYYEPALYSALRELDKLALDLILIEQPPAEESWMAVNDRLSKATV